MARIDDIIEDYSNRLEEIYKEQTAGAHTFTGVLANMLWEMKYSGLLAPELSVPLNPKKGSAGG